jgi:hypothetical protein
MEIKIIDKDVYIDDAFLSERALSFIEHLQNNRNRLKYSKDHAQILFNLITEQCFEENKPDPEMTRLINELMEGNGIRSSF